jgi:hypothetical protein
VITPPLPRRTPHDSPIIAYELLNRKQTGRRHRFHSGTQEDAALKNLGIVSSIAVGPVILVLGLFGTLGGGTSPRGLVAAAVVIIATRVILLRRGRRRASV